MDHRRGEQIQFWNLGRFRLPEKFFPEKNGRLTRVDGAKTDKKANTRCRRTRKEGKARNNLVSKCDLTKKKDENAKGD